MKSFESVVLSLFSLGKHLGCDTPLETKTKMELYLDSLLFYHIISAIKLYVLTWLLTDNKLNGMKDKTPN